MFDIKDIESDDFEIYLKLCKEIDRQNNNIELIASENFVSKSIMAVMGSPLTNKYAEGYPKKRYYGGCKYIDEIETLAIERAKILFNANFANVQPHCGSNANLAVYFALAETGDTILGMNLSHGGHLTHGSPVNFSGKNYNFISYGVDKETGFIDYNEIFLKAEQYKPKIIVAGASAYPRKIDFKKFKDIADLTGAYFMVDMAHIAGLVATGHHDNPVAFADVVTSTTHKTLRGPRGGLIVTNNEDIAKLIDKAIFPGTQGGPLEHVIAAKAICFKEALTQEFKNYSNQVIKNSNTLARSLINNGFNLVSGGTDNHLILVDLRNKNITGKDAEAMLDKVRVTCNKNSIPFDTESPFITSGIRLGTPAVTTRGYKEKELIEVGEIINMVIGDFESNKSEALKRVEKLTLDFPLFSK